MYNFCLVKGCNHFRINFTLLYAVHREKNIMFNPVCLMKLWALTHQVMDSWVVDLWRYGSFKSSWEVEQPQSYSSTSHSLFSSWFVSPWLLLVDLATADLRQPTSLAILDIVWSSCLVVPIWSLLKLLTPLLTFLLPSTHSLWEKTMIS